MSDKIVVFPGASAPTEHNVDNALNTLVWLYEEVKQGRITSCLVTTLAPNDDTACYIVNVGHTNKLKFYGMLEVLRRFLQLQ